ncbi:hypothetical protein ACFWXK_30100 [Streptomyces sp. NPDC059070]|uniref:hypothetical protein n=1 Tax=Streptomyces sp. NPDC059070 TaxID=3346713 RepID=UPI003694DC31
MGDIERPRRVVRPPTAPLDVRPAGPAAAPPWQQGPRARPREEQAQDTGRRLGRANAPGLHSPLYGTRSDRLREAVARLDARFDEAARRRLADWIREEYEVQHTAVPVGFVTKCFLGPPHVDHILDLSGAIVEHYAPSTPMPEPFGGARMLARSGAYLCVEVYGDGLVLPVLPDGSVVRP